MLFILYKIIFFIRFSFIQPLSGAILDALLCLVLCYIDNLVAVAPGRTAYQMTTYLSETANYAVDGDYLTKSCTTMDYSYQWLAVDIDEPSTVRAVNVTNDSNLYYGKSCALLK
jgi:hypothetical protein